ncbi:ADP-ribosylglycohydrolase family protein [Aquimarina sp. RZ0]|uniref:ADP-ribosylglycohydrolase family protein n=1 Tax=Aquimarina sp. RZ0 TaxID=2607730 RepID=UPI0011F385C9|nr:ADP-ribosylglycohydrolase family protein [Aquimarina sp. RZ0]KAA1243488.1 ADP-ribosylglycohydrolase family protein [Aquimarina sp. RZ0]
MKTLLENIRGGILGVAVGDALGVPYEFLDRDQMDKKPAKDMIGYGTHNQPEGTWSDDSSLTFCLMESLCKGYDLFDIASKFCAWFYENLWTPRGLVFDIGITTKDALYQFKRGMTPDLCGGLDEYSNGNGSLMRILPLVYYLKDESDINIRYDIIKKVSSITHGHLRSVFSCFIYVEYALLLLQNRDKFEAFEVIKRPILDFAIQNDFNPKEITLFSRILEEDISKQNRFDIQGSGYVLKSLEAAFWCLLTSTSYEESVLKAINLGEDTDTTAAITGGLSGLYYGYESIPETWKFQLARFDDIEGLIERFNKSLL